MYVLESHILVYSFMDDWFKKEQLKVQSCSRCTPIHDTDKSLIMYWKNTQIQLRYDIFILKRWRLDQIVRLYVKRLLQSLHLLQLVISTLNWFANKEYVDMVTIDRLRDWERFVERSQLEVSCTGWCNLTFLNTWGDFSNYFFLRRNRIWKIHRDDLCGWHCSG